MFELYEMMVDKIKKVLLDNNITNVEVYYATEVPQSPPKTYIVYDLQLSTKKYEKKVYILNMTFNTKEKLTSSNISKELIDLASLFDVVANYTDLSNKGFLETNFSNDNLSVRINELSGSQLFDRENETGEILKSFQMVFLINVNDNRG